MKRKYRLTKLLDFERVRRTGKSYAHPLVVLLTLPNGTEKIRIGFAAGKSIGMAVMRNRAKRIMRAAIQPSVAMITPGTDIILIARGPIKKAKSNDLKPILEKLMHNAKITKNGR